MIFTVPQIVVYLSEFMSLMPGDVILTGTPNGVAYNKPEPDYLRPGDLLRCGIEGLGEQLTQVARVGSRSGIDAAEQAQLSDRNF
jgi:2-keto-4-pentenoate hydratase/2-oxohepta-3-ene-1,7-dioic acid hydratase in catechol pathway